MIVLKDGIRFKTKSNLKLLKTVLNKWTASVAKYSNHTEGDACWWYTERANVGMLASSAWQARGWIALEEYSTRKRGKTGKSRNGRCDLYIAKENHDQSFALEAKQAWQAIRNPQHQVVEKCLKKAWDDAGNLKKQEAGTRVAACFVIPYIPLTLASDNLDAQLHDWLKDILDFIQWDAVAWSFPKICRRLTNDEGYVYPGVLLVLQERKRAARVESIQG